MAVIAPLNAGIAAGETHTCALTSGGGVSCWGGNDSGQLGNGSNAGSFVPVDISGLGSVVIAIAAGGNLTCALTNGGGVRCWGNGEDGQLGNGTTTSSAVPVDVSGLDRGIKAIATSGAHACAITSEGGIKCWGSNGSGELGDGTTTDSLVPVDVAGLASDVARVSTGFGHTCALMTDGRVKCWGYNNYGQLGNGTTTDSRVPVDVSSLASGVGAIAAGPEHTCAITSGGGVRCWGDNSSGQLGNGTTINSAVPVNVSGLERGVTAIATNYWHTCAVTTEGGVRCWGSNRSGELGDGTTTASLVPVDVSGLASGVSAIAAGQGHTCALTSGGAVKCWGDNWDGQLGNGSPCGIRSSSSAPVDVDFAAPSSASEPTATPIGWIEHAMGPTDVVLRFDSGPDLGVSELTGEFFQPGPEFTLFGDGTVIFRNERAALPPAEGPIIRAVPFTIARLDKDQIQSLLRFAIGEGGLGNACDRYETRDVDDFGSTVITVRAGGLDKRVEVVGSTNPFEELANHLRNFDGGGNLSSQVWVPDRYWGNLLEAGSAIEIGLLPDPRDAGIVPWPWPDLAPAEFVRPVDPSWADPRRVMSAEEAAVLGLSDNGGVVQRIYLLGPNRKSIYSFSLWPMFPDETN